MGVHELWPILEPVKQHVPLQSLSGKTLAVDLSIWVCEAQSVRQMVGVVAKPHLRNLFFRVSSLSLMEVKLVFVSEGEAPKVKADTMNRRNEMRYGASNKPAPARPGRSYFKSVLKECLRMLDCLGVPWVEAAGEAEAMCAYLNAMGYVDGCITNDGDVFLYGAQTVYRNFTMNVKDPHVDRYEMSTIKDKLGLERESLVGLAILLGCDYIPKGLPGVGRELAMKFIKSLNGESVLQRFYQWKKQFDDPTVTPKTAKKAVHCSVCCHPGSSKEHERIGCKLCGSERYCEPHDYDYCCPCDWHKAQEEKNNRPVEYTLKMKAKKREGFPYREVIREFLVNKDKLVKVIKWVRPSLLNFQKFALERMEWPRHYSCEKLLVLLTYYDMHERKAGRVQETQLQAVRIVKTRVRNGVPCFEIEWVKPDGYVFPDDHPIEDPLLTIEEEALVTAAYPCIVEVFQKDKVEAELQKQKCKKSKPKPKVLPNVDDVSSLLSKMSITPAMESPSTLPISDTNGEPWTAASLGPTSQSPDLLFPVDPSPPSMILVPTEKNFSISTRPLYTEDDRESLHDECFSLTQGNKQEPTVSSPNISSVISDLNLSSINWEDTSFSKSPSLESRTSCKQTHEVNKNPTTDKPGNTVTESSQKTVGPSNGKLIERTEPFLSLDSACNSHLQKLPLRERILLKNTVQSAVLHNFNHKRPPLKSVSTSNDSRETIKSKSTNCVNFKENVPTQVHNKLSKGQSPQKNKTQNVAVTKAPERPVTKSFTFVKKTTSVPVRNLSDGSISNRTATKAATKAVLKKSVCRKMSLSSEDEDTDVKYGIQKERKGSKTAIPVGTVSPVLPPAHSLPDAGDGSSLDDVFISPEYKTVRTIPAQSPEEQSDGDDSIVSVDSPLPLSERLKLRLLQNC
ncbi:flap endonuclease GEN homolog 1 [Mixophyes fleayi]|uniref:flap endonuclease GEN homolog 1 n=1 Tax=Mixophyes fleayi TaxID=3061075 RepID=UPI003F4E44CC